MLVNTVLADYRVPIYRKLDEGLGDFYVLAGRKGFADGVAIGTLDASKWTCVENRYFFGKRLCYQSGTIVPAFRAQVCIVELNPRVLSNWLILILRKASRRPTIAWGHAWPRGGKDEPTDRYRNWFRSLFEVIVVYTESQAADLRLAMPRKRIVAAPNALYTQDEILNRINVAPVSRKDFIFVGRFVPQKKPALALRAFRRALDHLPADCRLIMVGDGPERAALHALATDLGLGERVVFPGWISAFEGLRPYYARAVAALSPGFVGLSITQAFAFGVPMIVSKDEPHAPEIEAFVEGENGAFFATDSEEALGEALRSFYAQREAWSTRSEAIRSDCARRYSVDLLVQRVSHACRIALKVE